MPPRLGSEVSLTRKEIMAQNGGARARNEYRNCTSKNQNASSHFCLTLLETTQTVSNSLESMVGKYENAASESVFKKLCRNINGRRKVKRLVA